MKDYEKQGEAVRRWAEPASFVLESILAIEAEAAAQGAAESAAAEPTRWHHCDEECVGGERAAQPPRGSQHRKYDYNEPHPFESADLGNPTYSWCICGTPRINAIHTAGGSLTVTEPLLGCYHGEPHVCRRCGYEYPEGKR